MSLRFWKYYSFQCSIALTFHGVGEVQHSEEMKKITIQIYHLQVLPFSWVGYAAELSIHGCDLIQSDQLPDQLKQ